MLPEWGENDNNRRSSFIPFAHAQYHHVECLQFLYTCVATAAKGGEAGDLVSSPKTRVGTCVVPRLHG